MKNILRILIGLIVIVFIACGEKNKDEAVKIDDELYKYDSTEIKTEPIDDNLTFKLEYKFDKGDKIVYRLASISESSQKLIVDTTINNSFKQEIVYLIEFEPKSTDSDGTVEAEVNIIGLKLNGNFNGEKISFDAVSEKDTQQVQRFAEYASLWNNPFSVRFTKYGEILEVFRVDKISNKFFKLRNADSVDVQTKNMVKDDMKNNVLKPIVGQIIRKVTDQTLAKDSVWKSSPTTVPMMVFQVKFQNKYKVDSIEKLNDDKLAVLQAGIDYTVEGDPKFSDQGVDYKFNKPVSKGEGKIYFNISKGRIEKSKTTSTTSFSFTMEANTPQGKQKGKREEFVSNTNILELVR